MIDTEIIMNKQPRIIIKLFIFNISILIIFTTWGINTLYYQSFFHIHSKVLYQNSIYLLEVLIPAKEVLQVEHNNKLIIDSKTYTYKIKKIDNNIIYKNNNNYLKMYLEIFNLKKDYLINGYELDIKIFYKKEKIINYFKNKKEEKNEKFKQ